LLYKPLVIKMKVVCCKSFESIFWKKYDFVMGGVGNIRGTFPRGAISRYPFLE